MIVSSAGIYFKIWIAAILGILGGVIYVISCLLFKTLKIDDPLHIAQTHGMPALAGLILITFFHNSKGIFFINISQLITNKVNSASIINIFGANILGLLIIIGWVGIVTFVFYLLIKKCCLRVNKVDEIIGLDITQDILGKKELENFI